MGASQELELLSDKLIHSLDQIIPPREKPTEAANSSEKSPAQGDDPLLGHNPSSAKEKHETNRQHSIVLNHHAYVRAELGGDLARAIQEASLSVSLDPSADNLDTLGWAKIQAKLIPEGIHTLQKALLYNETRSAGTINYHLGYAFHQAGDQETARKHFENALRYDLDWWDEKVLVQVCPECLKNSAQ
jgi:tetratricopeptide (TPR) repeat protein